MKDFFGWLTSEWLADAISAPIPGEAVEALREIRDHTSDEWARNFANAILTGKTVEFARTLEPQAGSVAARSPMGQHNRAFRRI